ncbi:hypothetical protein OUZ56_029800 [Daphnia magna]|uniref:BPTI/Kunitz inhibitor domain-containing protein n=1 Tax=Daphnia magna TaxID=35525 RepID=A0ABR0B7W3_9CRUS|nr:hypothetical protein OUZ56_029800 [Daphnia magna]
MYSTSDPDICRTSDGLPCVMWEKTCNEKYSKPVTFVFNFNTFKKCIEPIVKPCTMGTNLKNREKSNSISFRGLKAVRQNMTTTPVRVQVPGLNLQQEIGSSIRYTSATCLTHSVATPSQYCHEIIGLITPMPFTQGHSRSFQRMTFLTTQKPLINDSTQNSNVEPRNPLTFTSLEKLGDLLDSDSALLV